MIDDSYYFDLEEQTVVLRRRLAELATDVDRLRRDVINLRDDLDDLIFRQP